MLGFHINFYKIKYSLGGQLKNEKKKHKSRSQSIRQPEGESQKKSARG